LHKVKDEIIEFRHMPGGDEDKLIIVEATLWIQPFIFYNFFYSSLISFNKYK
jgi:hypothetical protein